MEPISHFLGLSNVPIFSTAQPDWKEEELEQAEMAYVLDGKGWKRLKKSQLFTAIVAVKELEIPELKSFVQLHCAKIPFELLNKVTAFFSAVYQAHKSEAAGLLVYHPSERSWDFVVPRQTATGGSANYGDEKDPREAVKEWLEKGYILAGTIHSHGSMGAFHSGTDHKDEQLFDGIHITIGHVDKMSPEYACSIECSGSRQEKISLSSLVTTNAREEKVPLEWMEAVREAPPKEACGKDGDERYGALWDSYYRGEMNDVEYATQLDALRRQDGANKPKQAANITWNSNGNANWSSKEFYQDREKGYQERQKEIQAFQQTFEPEPSWKDNDLPPRQPKRKGKRSFFDSTRFLRG